MPPGGRAPELHLAAYEKTTQLARVRTVRLLRGAGPDSTCGAREDAGRATPSTPPRASQANYLHLLRPRVGWAAEP
jgi:hypothetical protein